MSQEESQAKEDMDDVTEDQEDVGASQDEEYGVEQSAEEDDIFKNNHDLIGVQGILKA